MRALAHELLPGEAFEAFGPASNDDSNNVMFKIRTPSGTYGLKFFRRETLDIEEVARIRVQSFVEAAPF